MSEPKKEKPTCPYCGSYEITCDANAVWNPETQIWEVGSTFANGYCNGCDTETKYFTWVPHEDT